MTVYLDTNVVIWICEGKTELFSAPVARILEREDLVVSPFVILELQYLYEVKRLLKPAPFFISHAQSLVDLRVKDASLDAVVQAGLYEDWTRDPFDRMIVAQARAEAMAPLITADRQIRRHYPKAVW